MDRMTYIHNIWSVPNLGICVFYLLKILWKNPEYKLAKYLASEMSTCINSSAIALLIDMSHVHLVQDGLSYVKAYAYHWSQMKIMYVWK